MENSKLERALEVNIRFYDKEISRSNFLSRQNNEIVYSTEKENLRFKFDNLFDEGITSLEKYQNSHIPFLNEFLKGENVYFYNFGKVDKKRNLLGNNREKRLEFISVKFILDNLLKQIKSTNESVNLYFSHVIIDKGEFYDSLKSSNSEISWNGTEKNLQDLLPKINKVKIEDFDDFIKCFNCIEEKYNFSFILKNKNYKFPLEIFMFSIEKNITKATNYLSIINFHRQVSEVENLNYLLNNLDSQIKEEENTKLNIKHINKLRLFLKPSLEENSKIYVLIHLYNKINKLEENLSFLKITESFNKLKNVKINKILPPKVNLRLNSKIFTERLNKLDKIEELNFEIQNYKNQIFLLEEESKTNKITISQLKESNTKLLQESISLKNENNLDLSKSVSESDLNESCVSNRPRSRTNFSSNLSQYKIDFFISKYQQEIFKLTKENKKLKDKIINIEEFSFYNSNQTLDPINVNVNKQSPGLNLSLFSLNNLKITNSAKKNLIKIPSMENSLVAISEYSSITQERVESFEFIFENNSEKLKLEILKLKSVILKKNKLLEESERIINDGRKLKEEFVVTKQMFNDYVKNKQNSKSEHNFNTSLRNEFDDKIKFLNEALEKSQNCLKMKNKELESYKALEIKNIKILEKLNLDTKELNTNLSEKELEINKIRLFYSSKYLNKKNLINNFTKFLACDNVSKMFENFKKFMNKIEHENSINFSSELFEEDFQIQHIDVSNFRYYLQKINNLKFVIKFDNTSILNELLYPEQETENIFTNTYNKFIIKLNSLFENLVKTLIKENSKLFFFIDNTNKLLKQLLISNYDCLILKKKIEHDMSEPAINILLDDSTVEEINVYKILIFLARQRHVFK